MIGERHFALRDRLLACGERIEALAAETTRERDQEWAGECRERLGRPVRLVVLGEVNGGKSSLINALSGEACAPVSPLPTTRRVVCYGGGEAAAAECAEAGWEHAPRESAFFQAFELIDTPGTDSDWRDALWRELPRLEGADGLLVVFPATNPWTAATWELLARLSAAALARTWLIIQQADRKSREDLRVIAGHMRELSVKKLGRERSILAVASCPGGAAAGKRVDWAGERPGMGALGTVLTREVCEAAPRRELLRGAWREAAGVLRWVEQGFDAARRSIDDDGWFLAGLEREARQRRDQLLEDLPRVLAEARGRYDNEVSQLVRRMRGALGFWPTLVRLFFGGSAASRIESSLAEGLGETIRDFARKDAVQLLRVCEAHWDELRPRVRERMGFDPGRSEMLGDGREEVVETFVEAVARAVAGIIAGLRVRASLDQPLRRRIRQLRCLLGLVLVVTTAAGTCGTLGESRWAWMLLGGAAVLAVVFVLAVWISRQRVIARTRVRLRDAVGTVDRGLRQEYVEAVHGVFARHLDGLHELRRQLAARAQELEPQQQAWDRLHLELKSIEQDAAF